MEIGTVVGSQDVSGNVYELTSGINVPALPTFPGKSEVQVLVTYHATTTVGGFFRLGYKGSAWTNYLPATISAANLKLALETLPTIGVVNVNLELMASAGNAFVIGQVWTITFISNVGNLPPLIVEPSKLTPADAFLGVKDGDNAVDGSGVLCLPGGDIACPGSWPVGIAGLRQQALPQKSVVELAVVGEAAVGYAFYETLDAATLTHTISPLIPGQAYFVAVTAKNALGLGIRAQTSPTSVIPPLQVPGPPTNVAVDVNPGVATQLVATWGAPTSDGGNPVRMYRIEYDPSPLFTNRGQQDAWCPVAPTTAVWRVQTKRTSADTTAPIGSGYFTLQLTRRNTPEPSEPIPWNAVATTREELGSAVVTNSKYVVQWDVAAGFDSLALTMGTTVTVNDPAQRSYTITGLTPGTLYYVRVFAKNRGGQGTPQTSTPASLVPAVTDPGKPNTLTIETTLVTGELRISWLAPQIPAHGYPCAGTLQVPGSCPVVGTTNMVFGGVDLKEYVVQYSEMSDFRIPTEQTTTALTVLLTGLDSSKTYYAQVYAVNSQGLKSAFCKRANTQSLLCPDQQVLLDSSVVTGDFVYAQPL
ncbi:hypothetical protein KRP22_004428 [Phytophthora ramorum]|nr:hypothetical protein KRP22_13531 [Phytophthora ramorum]